MRLSEIYGNEITEREKLQTDVMFNLHCCIPCIVQSYDAAKGTVECQPAIREKIINQNENIEYLNLPLLINVPVAFPSNNEYSVTFPLKTGDECLVFFSDLSIDNFWEKGDVQNPIEDRRHDLSDGIAYPCNLSLVKRRRTKDGLLLSSVNSGVLVKNSSVEVYTNGAKINISTSDIEFSCSAGTINVSDIIRHTHTAPPTGGETSKPNY